jgi:hypothetical protein
MRMMLAAATLSFLAVPAFAAEPVVPAVACAAGATCAAPVVAVVPVASVKPDGATGLCKDGTYTMVHHFSGACSSNKGIAKWY